MKSYDDFLINKRQVGEKSGFKPLFIPDYLFDFQKILVETGIENGRFALFEDCGLGKTIQELVFAENVVRHTNGKVLLLMPIAVGLQTIAEAEKFGIEVYRSRDGNYPADAKIIITNYQNIHKFTATDFSGCICDESGILKNQKGITSSDIREFMRVIKYRLLCTATASPNDYIELGTSAEALGDMKYIDMLGRFFKNDQNSNHPNRLISGGEWRFRGHAERDFWRWVCSWARAIRKPSDLGFDDGNFKLPPLNVIQHEIESRTLPDGYLFPVEAVGLQEQRKERSRTINERCEKVAELVNETDKPAICWCSLNPEGDLLEKLIPGAVQVSGKDSDDSKEENLIGFSKGDYRVLITKPTIAGYGMNWQHCAHQTYFPSHSFEQYYQSVRRCWRFGQKNHVTVDLVTTTGEQKVLKNMQRKSDAMDEMFDRLIEHMNDAQSIRINRDFNTKTRIPKWL